MNESHRSKVARRHLSRQAVVYVRQSTLRQVREHTESTRRQYGLREEALALGWHPDQIVVLDEDLGKSGTAADNRAGFQRLVDSVTAGKTGIVLGLEVSRLARNNADWHQLLELAAHSHTLILDETGIYDPREFNDRTLLGFKGQFSEVELFSIIARLHGGIRNKARRGEFKTRLPVGLVYRQDDTVALDPDSAVRSAIECVFDTFQRLESATATWRWLANEGVRLPGSVQHGPRRGERLWLDPTLTRVLGYVNNPRYSGAYAWGRLPGAAAASPPTAAGLQERWQVLLPDFHPGYIDWERFVANQAILAGNRGQFANRPPAPRNGCALLQSRVLCGRCGGRMFVQYVRNRSKASSQPKSYAYYVCRDKRLPNAGGTCQTVSAKAIDAAVGRQIVAAVGEEHVAVALAVQDEVRLHAAQAAAAREQRLRQLEYQADLAAQRYYAVDPRHRTVAARLEADWNECLCRVEQALREHERLQQADRSLVTPEERERIAALARDFSRIWDAPETQPVDRKRMLAALVEDVTLVRSPYSCQVRMRFHGGALREVEVPLPCGASRLHEVQPDLVRLIVRLSATRSAADIADELNQRGHTAYQNRPFSAGGVRRVQRANGVPSRTAQLRARGLRTAREVAELLGVSQGTVRTLADRGLLQRELISQGPRRTRALYAVPEGTDVAEILRTKGQRKAVRPEPARDDRDCDTE